MAAPPKPWEKQAMNQALPSMMNFDAFGRNNLGHHLQPSTGVMPTNPLLNGRNPPPLPPRTMDLMSPSTMRMNFPSHMGYSHYSPSYYPHLPSFYNSSTSSPYRYGMDSFLPENSFVRLADESTRPAFQSIESIVHAVASVSAMLESTYIAVHSSFRAVLGVADHFSRLRAHLAQLVSTLALLRTLRWILKKILYILGLIKSNPSMELAWEQVNAASEATLRKNRSTWPILMFFSAVLGAPWLIWKVLARINEGVDPDGWARGEENYIQATAQYDFKTDNPKELPFTAGQQLRVAPKELQPRVKGWLLASIDGTKIGFVPANYVKIQGVKSGNLGHVPPSHAPPPIPSSAGKPPPPSTTAS